MNTPATNFAALQADFLARRKGSLALPITGAIVYAAIAITTLFIEPASRNIALALGYWAIMPIGLLIGKARGEEMGSPPDNPLFRLSAMARIMALSSWAVHIPVLIYAPALFPLTFGIIFALHWVVFSWTIGHPVGLIHLAMRILFVLIAWHFVPANRVGAVCAGIALAYAISTVQLGGIYRASLKPAEAPLSS